MNVNQEPFERRGTGARGASRGAGLILMLAGAALLVSCTTPRTPSDTLGQPVKMSLGDELAARKEVDELSKKLSTSANSTVIPELLQTISKYPGTEAGIEARFLLAKAYQSIGSSPDAVSVYSEYLRLAPSGRYAAEAQKSMAQLQEEYDKRYPSPQTLEAQIAQVGKEVQAAPDDPKKQMELADLLWKRSNYGKSAEIYASVITRWPEYLQAKTIRSRMEFQADGSYIVLSPGEVQRRQIEAQPLECINLASFHSGRDLFTREARYYAVTGQVVNHSDSVLYGVEVLVTIYGFGNVVYDTTTVTIPRLNPKEIRAFSVRFSNFENIENVYRYECVANFQR
ncbi:MAG: FxLYD domain-containing protein [Candidatus Hydrogenedentes bacterium]|nr:FxLYD domain-containing protein [Candidatus Hydrogenedentota bacterium]